MPGRRLRPLAYPFSKLLQSARGLCHPACFACLPECLRQDAFARRELPRFVAITSLSARCSPSLHFALWLVQLLCFLGFSPRDETPFPVSIHGHVRVPLLSTPPEN